MKFKKICIGVILLISICIISSKVLAAELTNIEVTTTKTTINPEQNVKVKISFGESLGAYTIDIAYDSNLFEYVSTEDGTANDNGTRIRVTYYDQTGGSNPKTTANVTFKAKSEITTSNPTEFVVTAGGLANADASVSYDDITVGIVKDVIVEPAYTDYTLDLTYTGTILENEAKNMDILIESEVAKNYEKTRLIAEVTTPEDGVVTLKANQDDIGQVDIIQSGYGSNEGDSIGGGNITKDINAEALFTKAGDYTITLKLIDRENSDNVIVENTFNISVLEDTTTNIPNDTTESNNTTVENNTTIENTNSTVENTTTDNDSNTTTSEELPKTGNTIYAVVILTISGLFITIAVLNKKKENI